MNTPVMKSCPFCGKMPILKTDTRYPRPECEPRKAYEVMGQTVDCIIGFVDERYRLYAKEAVETWNRRANDENRATDTL